MTKVLTYKRKPPVVRAIQWLGQEDYEIMGVIMDHGFDARNVSGAPDEWLFIDLKNGATLSCPLRGYLVFGEKKMKTYSEEAFREKYEVC